MNPRDGSRPPTITESIAAARDRITSARERRPEPPRPQSRPLPATQARGGGDMATYDQLYPEEPA